MHAQPSILLASKKNKKNVQKIQSGEGRVCPSITPRAGSPESVIPSLLMLAVPNLTEKSSKLDRAPVSRSDFLKSPLTFTCKPSIPHQTPRSPLRDAIRPVINISRTLLMITRQKLKNFPLLLLALWKDFSSWWTPTLFCAAPFFAPNRNAPAFCQEDRLSSLGPPFAFSSPSHSP